MLLSFAFFSTADIGALRKQMPCGRLMIDSGAFTALSTGRPIQLDDYARFLETWRGSWDQAVTLDVIGDPVATMRNTRKLHDRGINVMPVFTRGGTVEEFDSMVKEFGYVCVGGGVGMPKPLVIDRLSALQHRAEQNGGGIHALGVGNMNGVRQIRPFSCDASNISSSFVWGRMICYDGRRFHSVRLVETKLMRKLLIHFRDQGLEMAEMAAARRQPKGQGRVTLMQGMSVGYACADEDTVGFKVPVPHGINDTVGTHMYSAVTGGFLAPALAELDAMMHSETWTVPLWDRYRDRHRAQCRA